MKIYSWRITPRLLRKIGTAATSVLTATLMLGALTVTPAHAGDLGGLDLYKYCDDLGKIEYGAAFRGTEINVEKTSSTTWDWFCKTTYGVKVVFAEAKRTSTRRFDYTRVCRTQYQRHNATARVTDKSNPNSIKCFTP